MTRLSVRFRFLIIFAILAIVPPVVLGWLSYADVRYSAIELASSRQESESAATAATVAERYGVLEDELARFASRYGPTALERGSIPQVPASYDRIVARRLGSARNGEAVAATDGPAGCAAAEQHIPVSVPIHDGAGAHAGWMDGWLSVRHLLERRFDDPAAAVSRRLLVIDRTSHRILNEAGCRTVVPVSLFVAPGGQVFDAAGLPGHRGRLEFMEGGVAYLAAWTDIDRPAWRVVSVTSRDAAIMPEVIRRMAPLVIILLLVTATAGGAAVMIADNRRSLKDLARAADSIGQGDLSPWLPPPGGDPVGRLSHALGLMAARLRDAMRRAERHSRLATIGQMSMHLSHEIRNPLSSIRVNLKSLQLDRGAGIATPGAQRLLSLCLGEVERLDGALKKVLSAAPYDSGALEPVSMTQVVQETCELARPHLESEGITMVVDTPSAPLTVAANEGRLHDAVLNLLLNARDAMAGGQGGTLRVRVEAGREASPWVRVRVADDGPGVPPALRRRIFAPFFTTKPEGTGLGLALACRAVEAFDGRLYLVQRSELERGAEFVIELPLAKPDEEWRAAARAAVDEDGDRRTRGGRWPRRRAADLRSDQVQPDAISDAAAPMANGNTVPESQTPMPGRSA